MRQVLAARVARARAGGARLRPPHGGDGLRVSAFLLRSGGSDGSDENKAESADEVVTCAGALL